MENYKIEHLTFTYPNQTVPALKDVSLSVGTGEFVTLFGKSGCGKTTLLRMLKPSLSPFGTVDGQIMFFGQPLSALDERKQCEKIGFVLQNPDNQIVTDKVWHELAFGAESLGLPADEIRAKVAEMASFFGIHEWFHKDVSDLSGGQKQLLNLASVMVMQPSVLILDEPTGQLDPIAASEFLDVLAKINRETGTTVILSEHRLEEAFAMSDRVILLSDGEVSANGSPEEVGKMLKLKKHEMCAALPTPMRIYAGVENQLRCPVTVRDGRDWLDKMSEKISIDTGAEFKCGQMSAEKNGKTDAPAAIEVKDIWFRYEKNLPDVLKGLTFKANRGELYAVMGGNGTGKSTALSVICGLLSPYRGTVKIFGKKMNKKDKSLRSRIGLLPQSPKSLFLKKTVELDLLEIFVDSNLSEREQRLRVNKASEICGLNDLLSRHPYDLSGGEQQRAALAKVLLSEPEILLLDEPTKGFDSPFKNEFAEILNHLKKKGIAIVMVSHDIEFCAEHADRCALFFGGVIVSENKPRPFFAGKQFYTTAANRMARNHCPNAVLTEDVILALGGRIPEKCQSAEKGAATENFAKKMPEKEDGTQRQQRLASNKQAQRKPGKIIFGAVFGALFVMTMILFFDKVGGWQKYIVQAVSLLELTFCLISLMPKKKTAVGKKTAESEVRKQKYSKNRFFSDAALVLAVLLTIFIGMYYLGDRKYYFISLLIILEAMAPFAVVFEKKKQKARELVIISVLCAIAVAGRVVFSPFPQFKPVVSVIVIAGVCFGGEIGFFVGAVTAFLSNFYFSQGPWTPWQMFAFGIVGFFAGVLFKNGFLRKNRWVMCIFGGLATLILYGGIMNTASVLMIQAKPDAGMLLSAYAMGLPMDLIHAGSTVFFMWFISEPMLEKLDRTKEKYGLGK